MLDILCVPPIPQQIQISVDQPYAGPAASCCGIIGTHSTYKVVAKCTQFVPHCSSYSSFETTTMSGNSAAAPTYI
jgi:hypothetical protein